MKNKPLTQQQLQRNRLITKARYVVERTFGSQVRWFGSKIVLPGQNQSTCLAYFTSHGVQPEKTAPIIFKEFSRIGNMRLLNKGRQ